ncbi:hypothetical protein HN51_070370 [Arachis hypogaea]|uniref:BAH domain-containing protein n=2 Tax=Arachis hypogaea TaxID=3818 RepID=A0A444Z2N2_ARAHY|nr:uncharacterized protein LOC110272306 [Arachis ipaensis]XP_025655363.1 uncharacterized protein LOC112750751 isoform X1 [Arachis hypogaea]XP_025655364.1 uncharacterized protein LOC112750751 isoform X1 [Arachis hypogaea]XP_025655365.1 uncharacterized protein LOC112750751 isoform X1 [Arachis hypogaea]QHO12754.1 hypothetical protein DS421_15g509620 [Arachis hypogaea]QHO12755.1 hypothetical protein DS421_15g509620 [Arachis hypogaea]RYR08323.1 hypothetical protein Ahy_B05g075954 isoform A [Arachi
MHGSGSEEWKHSRHMWPNATAVAPDSSPSQFICKDGRKIYVGDCALFKPPRHSPPFIGIIRKLIFNKEESPTLEVNWLYRHADVKLTKGVLEAAPNEVFYSYHKNEISASSLLHPCKVAFLRKGVELPSGISAFVCRRVYDTENNCIWWLTDKEYINAVPEEVDRLLDKTKLEMHGAAQSGGRSPKPLNGPTSTQSLKSGSDSVQNSSSFGTQVKGKKRERGDQGSDLSKRERLFKAEDGDFGPVRSESMLRSEISKITDKGGLVDFEGVERLVQLMQPDGADKKIDLGGRIILVNAIAATERDDCLSWFVQLRGLPVLDEWLQEVHKGKNGDSNTPKESDKSVEEFLLALLRALDRLPVNLHALQTCNVGKSVNHLRTHKNSEIQRKARSLVDTWKKRVEAEMNMTDSKSGSTRPVSWQAKPAASEISHVGNKKTGGSENATKGSAIQSSVSKNSLAKHGSGEALSKSSSAPSSIKLMTTSMGCTPKDQNVKALVGAPASDQPLTPIKEERSSSSSQSQNNSLSCSSEHAKTIGSCREDSRSSTAVSMSASKIPGGTSRTRKSSNGVHGAGVALAQKEPTSVKSSTRNSPSEKVSPTRVSHEKSFDPPLTDQGNNQRLILRLPNTARSPSRGASGAASEEPAIPCGIASPPADKNESRDRRVKAKNDGLHTIVSSNVITDACASNEASTGCEHGKGSPIADEQGRINEDGDQVPETSKQSNLSSGFISRSGQTYAASLSPMNALVESCVKFSEASASVSAGDDGMNLLATVAAGEISTSGNVSPLASPERKSPVVDESSSGNVSKLKHPGEIAAHTVTQSDRRASAEPQLNAVDPVQFKNDSRHPMTTISRGSAGEEAISTSCKEKTGDDGAQMNVSTADLSQNAESPCIRPEIAESASETVPPSKKETREEPGGENYFHVQRDFGSQWVKPSSSDSKKEMVDHLDEAIVKNDEMLVSKETIAGVKIETELGEKLLKLSSDVGKDNKISTEVTGVSVQKSSVAESSESVEFKKVDVMPPSASGNSLMASRDENANEMKLAATNPDEKPMDLESTVPADVSGCDKDNSGLKEILGQCSGSSNLPALSKVPGKENEVSKTSVCNLDGKESDVAGEQHAHSIHPSLTVAGSDAGVILDFDLNEGFSVDDASHGEIVRQEEHTTSSAVHNPCALPFPISSISGGFHTTITVASAVKGRVVLPENPLRSKGELGWKGSAATSAFRPAEPRKNSETPSTTGDIPSVDSTSSKQGRAPLDFDLNVADERSFEDVGSHGSSESGPPDRSTMGLDLDLNRVDETPDAVSYSLSKLDAPTLPSKPSLSGRLSNGGSVSRDFDLNNGPGLDEVGTEVPTRIQQMKNSAPIPSAIHGTRANNAEYGNYSSWFPPGNSYSAITVPPLLPGRGEQSYVAAAGAQRIMGPTGSAAFGPELYRGPVLSSAPAVAYQPTAAPFPYPGGFPFETSFPLSSNSFSVGSATFIDSSTVGGLCFPTMPSQPVAPGGVVSSTYPRPYVMSLPGGTSNVIPDTRKWGSQSLDLNSGPGGTDTDRREEHMKMFQVAGVLKRKEPDGGWDGADRFSYKQPSWQ